jgi:epoxyqueuosine reductase
VLHKKETFPVQHAENLGFLFAVLKHGTIFHCQDFRAGWEKGIAVSKSMGLYCQQYSGCIYSEKDSYYPHNGN